jgi:hypothetical protein
MLTPTLQYKTFCAFMHKKPKKRAGRTTTQRTTGISGSKSKKISKDQLTATGTMYSEIPMKSLLILL